MLLQRFGIPFECQSPDIDETSKQMRRLSSWSARLADEKAESFAGNPTAIVIGSDQVAVFEGQIIGKPGNHEAAWQQLHLSAARLSSF